MKLDSLTAHMREYMRTIPAINPLREWMVGILLSVVLLVVGMAYAGSQFFQAYSDEVPQPEAPAANVTYKAKEVAALLERFRAAEKATAAFEAGVAQAPAPIVHEATSTPKEVPEVAPTAPLQVE